MQRTNTVIVGAGQCGLAMSFELSRRSIDHVVLERGQVGNSWRTERWDSLRLLTPNWLNGLFGHMPSDPDGYMPAGTSRGPLLTPRPTFPCP
jgi:putative flavoprotein involved in K+ transport